MLDLLPIRGYDIKLNNFEDKSMTATAVTVEQAKKYLKANCPVELQAKVKEYYSLGSEADRSNCFNEIAKIMPLTCDVNKAFIFFNVANGVESTMQDLLPHCKKTLITPTLKSLHNG